MTDGLMFPTALTLATLILAACNDGMTEPEQSAIAAPTAEVAASPELAVAANSWTTKADMPGTARGGLATATVTNAAGQSVLYAIGGQLATGGSLGRVQAYNVATNIWTWKADRPVAAYSTNGTG